VAQLRTQLVLRATGRSVTAPGAASRVYEYAEARSGVQYVAEPPEGLPLEALLAQGISRALGSPVTLPLHPLLAAAASASLPALQPLLLAAGYDPCLEAAAQAGQLGSALLPSDAALLQLRPLKRYCAGEVVAYADAAEAGPGARGGGGGEPVHRYGRVVADAGPTAAAAAVFKVAVEVQPGAVVQLLNTQLWSFRSGEAAAGAGGGGDSNGSSNGSGNGSGAAPVVSTADLFADEAGGSGGGGQQGQGGGAGAAAQPPAAGAAAAAGEAGAAGAAAGPRYYEVSAAVQELLSAAGLPLDLGRSQLLSELLAARESLGSAQKQLERAEASAKQHEEAADAAKQSWSCRVCFANEVQVAFTGCGHMLCQRCCDAVPEQRGCPMCRKYSGRVRLYK
jgi:sacsin